MQYRIFDTETREYLPEGAIVTQEGEVAWWDDTQGWTVDANQARYRVLPVPERFKKLNAL